MNSKIILLLVVFYQILLISCSPNKVLKNSQDDSVKSAQPILFSIPKLPHEMIFCGEKIILDDEDIRERLDKEVLLNAYYHSATIGIMKRAHRFFPQIERILKKENIPTDFKYLACIESSLNQAVSPAGAQGFWQFMPFTAKEFNLEMSVEVDERLNIEKSTYAACGYLRHAQDTLKDWLLTAASYNRGIGGVRSDMRWQGTDHYFDTDMNSETGRYTFRILAMKLIMENPKAYGFDVDNIEMYEPFKTKSIIITESIHNIAKWAIEKGCNFKIITKLNPWLKGNKLTIRKKHYKLLLPSSLENLKPYKAYN
ncbi:MAG: lytic transglycosylase domain-containing protein [Flavobacteriia bacterium]|nr:lytic transglycosylase domain-containing protein [Flavobacteriia bacterium]